MLSFHFRNGVPGAPADFLLTGKICLGNFFLISKSPFLGGVFFFWNFLYWRMDGWMGDGWVMGDGWMDGWVGLLFFGFVYFSKTTSYIILIVSGPHRRHFQVSFVKKWKKIKKLNFVKKFRTFRKIFGFLTIFEKNTGKSLVFLPTMVVY